VCTAAAKATEEYVAAAIPFVADTVKVSPDQLDQALLDGINSII
jgi:hypothetical protein